MIKTTEGKAIIYTDESHKTKISKDLEVFYNPLMKSNRDFTILFLNSLKKLKIFDKKITIGLPLAGSGIRAIRLLKETNMISKLYINDYDKTAIKNIKKNFRLNKIKKTNIEITNKDANEFLILNKGFDFIDLDPFGSPNPFLDTSIKRLSRGGFLAITATDTAALTGTYPQTTLWKYWAKTYLNPEKHEIGLRILIRKVQLVASQYERSLVPVLSYVKEHYYRVIFICKKSKTEAAEIIKQHKYYVPNFFEKTVGPLWTGNINNKEILNEMIKLCKDNEQKNFLELLIKESEVNRVGFIDLHEYMRKKKKQGIRHEELIEKLKSKGHLASRTHFSYKGIKTNINLEELNKIIKKEKLKHKLKL